MVLRWWYTQRRHSRPRSRQQLIQAEPVSRVVSIGAFVLVRHPLPFRQAFALFFRQMSPHVPMDEGALRAAGIGPWEALACMFLGWAVAVAIMIGAMWIFVQAISAGVWLFALVLFVPMLLMIQGTVTVVAYRLWLRLKSSKG